MEGIDYRDTQGSRGSKNNWQPNFRGQASKASNRSNKRDLPTDREDNSAEVFIDPI